MNRPLEIRPRFVLNEVNGKDDTVSRILCDLHERVFANTAPQIDPSEGFWWIAWRNRLPVAFAGLKLSKSTPGTAYLHRSGVLPAWRGHRLQRRLIRAREAKARELGCNRMVTDTTDNVASANSLIGTGYRLYTPDGPWAFSESLYWEKSLS